MVKRLIEKLDKLSSNIIGVFQESNLIYKFDCMIFSVTKDAFIIRNINDEGDFLIIKKGEVVEVIEKDNGIEVKLNSGSIYFLKAI